MLDGLRYRLRFPRAGSGGDQDGMWPLLVFLHGAGERGARLDGVLRHGPWQSLSSEMFFILAPLCPARRSWPEIEILEKVRRIIDDVEDSHPVDPRRTCLTGLSMGAFGVCMSCGRGEARLGTAVTRHSGD